MSDSDLWAFTDHVCRRCFGRVMQQGDQFMCADCGVVSQAPVEAICGCGIRVGEGKLSAQRLFRCAPNTAPAAPGTPQFGIGFGVPAAAEGKVAGWP